MTARPVGPEAVSSGPDGAVAAGVARETGGAGPDPMPLKQLVAEGVSIWLDGISRDLLVDGGLEHLVTVCHVTGASANSEVLAAALGGNGAYRAHLAGLAVRGVGAESALRAMANLDFRWACDVLRPVFEATDGVDGRVSVEVDPRLADDREAVLTEAHALWRAVNRPNLLVKIPATAAGRQAMSDCLADGISVNATLVFSLDRYAQVLDAYLDGLERAGRAGHDLARIGSVGSFSVGGLDRAIDGLLDRLGTPEATALRGRAAVANARLAYKLHEEQLDSDRWRSLVAAGARPQRPLWEFPAAADSSCSYVKYVEQLVSWGIVSSMTRSGLELFAARADLRGDTVTGEYHSARAHLDALAGLGISCAEVAAGLEADALRALVLAWDRLRCAAEEALRDAALNRRD